MTHRSTNALTILILIGLISGALVGEYGLHAMGTVVDGDHWLKATGDLVLIRPLKLLIIPLIFFSVISGITRIGDPSKLGLVGGATLLYYLSTMFIAVTLGTVLVTWISPGVLAPEIQDSLRETAGTFAAGETATKSLGSAWMNILYQIVPVNIFEDMVKVRPLGIIVFAIAFGLALAAGGDKTKAARDICNAAFEGIDDSRSLGYLAHSNWRLSSSLHGPLAKSVLNRLLDHLAGTWQLSSLALALHGFLILPLVLWVFAKKKPLPIYVAE